MRNTKDEHQVEPTFYVLWLECCWAFLFAHVIKTHLYKSLIMSRSLMLCSYDASVSKNSLGFSSKLRLYIDATQNRIMKGSKRGLLFFLEVELSSTHLFLVLLSPPCLPGAHHPPPWIYLPMQQYSHFHIKSVLTRPEVFKILERWYMIWKYQDR